VQEPAGFAGSSPPDPAVVPWISTREVPPPIVTSQRDQATENATEIATTMGPFERATFLRVFMLLKNGAAGPYQYRPLAGSSRRRRTIAPRCVCSPAPPRRVGRRRRRGRAALVAGRPPVDAAGGRGYPDAVNYDPNEDFYVVFGVPDTASHAEIRAAYRVRIQHAHPDKSTGNTSTATALNVAWGVLGDPQKRAAYDDRRRRYLASVAAAAVAPSKARPARAKKVRARAAAPVAPKVTRKAAPATRKAAAPPPPSAVDFAVENLMRSIQNAEYGKAFGWFILGALASDAKRPSSQRGRAVRRQRRAVRRQRR